MGSFITEIHIDVKRSKRLEHTTCTEDSWMMWIDEEDTLGKQEFMDESSPSKHIITHWKDRQSDCLEMRIFFLGCGK